MFKKAFCFVLCMCGIVLPAQALDPFGVYKNDKVPTCQEPNLSKTIDLLEAMEIAVCESPTLKASYLSTQVSAAGYGQSLASYLPDITGTASVTANSSKTGSISQDATNAAATLSLNWLLFDFGARSNTAEKFKSYLSSAYYGYDNTFQTTLYNVAESYYNVLSAVDNYDSLKASEESAKKAFEEANSRFKLGLVPLSDKLQAETAYAQARLNTTVGKKQIALKKGAFATQLNLPPYIDLKLQKINKKVTDKKTLDKVNKLIEVAFANRPDYKAMQMDKQAAEANVKATEAGHLPTVNATASGGANKNVKTGGDSTYQGSAGLQLNVPIFSGFSQSYKVGEARYNAKKAEEQLNQLKLDIQNEVWAAVQDYKTSFETHQISKTLLDSAKESERVAFASYKVGKANILTLLDAQSNLAEARVEYATTFYNFLIAKNNLMRVLGKMEKQK